MDSNDQMVFFQGLRTLGTVFNREVTGDVQVAYWDIFSPRCTLAEWQAIVPLALTRRYIPPFPLPADLLDLLAQHRREQAMAAQRLADVAQAQIDAATEAHEQHFLTDPAWQAAQETAQQAMDAARDAQRDERDTVGLQAIQMLREQLGWETPAADVAHNPPHAIWDGDETYAVTYDVAARKRELRRQYEQLQVQESTCAKAK